jgi:hypothetical protein
MKLRLLGILFCVFLVSCSYEEMNNVVSHEYSLESPNYSEIISVASHTKMIGDVDIYNLSVLEAIEILREHSVDFVPYANPQCTMQPQNCGNGKLPDGTCKICCTATCTNVCTGSYNCNDLSLSCSAPNPGCAQ